MASISPETRVGPVHLTVADLDRSLSYYDQALGLVPRGESSTGGTALGPREGGEDLLVLHEEPGARPVRGHTGLYHYALLVPTREDLARWLAHVARTRVPLTGLSDHLVSEAIYLSDPDGHGIEIYADRPRDEWQHDGDEIVMDVLPLDAQALLGVLGPDAAEATFDGLAGGTTMGHVHLHVADVPTTDAFYRDVLGFDRTANLGPQASFFSAGGYHHHLAGNTWAGQGASPPPPGSAALRHATIVLPDAAERDAVVARAADAGQEPEPVDGGGVIVRDPSQNALLLTTSAE